MRQQVRLEVLVEWASSLHGRTYRDTNRVPAIVARPTALKISGGSRSVREKGGRGQDADDALPQVPFRGRKPRQVQVQFLFDDVFYPQDPDDLHLEFLNDFSLRGFVTVSPEEGQVQSDGNPYPNYVEKALEFFRLTAALVGDASLQPRPPTWFTSSRGRLPVTPKDSLGYFHAVLRLTLSDPRMRMLCMLESADVEILRVYNGTPIRATVDVNLTEVTPTMLTGSSEQQYKYVAIGVESLKELSRAWPIELEDEGRAFANRVNQANQLK